MRPLIVSLLAFAQTAFAFTPTGDGLYAVFDTSKGEFTAGLDFELVPTTVASFVGLAEGTIPRVDANGAIVTEPFFDGQKLMQVAKNGWIWAGSPDGTVTGGPGYTFPDEFHPQLPIIPKGTLAMYNTNYHSNGSLFYVTLGEGVFADFDEYYPVFGLVIDGQATLDAIGNVAVDNQGKPTEPITINKITIVRVGTKAKNFNAAGLPLPHLEKVPALIDNGDLEARFDLQANAKYLVATSQDLETWNRQTVAPTALDTRIFDLKSDAEQNGKSFVSVGKRVAPEARQERIGYTFTPIVRALPNGQTPMEWVHKLMALNTTTNTAGTVTIDGESWDIIEHRYYELGPKKGNLDISLGRNGNPRFFVRYNLFFGTETSGNYFANIDDYKYETSYPSTGTFSLTQP